MKDYYKLLEVNETASPEVIQAAYKILAKKYHPDIAKPNEKAMKEAKMKEINNAKEILLNPVEREKYDMMLRQERERLKNQALEAKVERHRETKRQKVKKASKKKVKYENPDSAQATVGQAFSGFFSLFKDVKNNKNLIVICSFLFLLAFVQIFLCIGYFTGAFDNFGENIESINVIIPDKTTKEEIIEIFGRPSFENDTYLSYGENAKILIDNDEIVVGWIDTYQDLDFLRYDELTQAEDISIGMDKNDIVDKWGMPDTYSKDIIVYYNLIIKFSNDKVIEVVKQD